VARGLPAGVVIAAITCAGCGSTRSKPGDEATSLRGVAPRTASGIPGVPSSDQPRSWPAACVVLDPDLAKRLVPAVDATPQNQRREVCLYTAPGTPAEEAGGTDRVSLGLGGENGAKLLEIFVARAEENRRANAAIHERVERVSGLADAAACSSFGPVSGTYFITVQIQRGVGGIELAVWTHSPNLSCTQVVPVAREINAKVS
jgi:hypothetical protein